MRTKKQGVLKNNIFDKTKINDGHYLELLDRTYIICEMIDTHLIKHPLSENDDELNSQLEYVLEKLYNIYQSLGKKIK
jgi:hypothetical protein